MASEEWWEEESSWNYIVTPAFLTSFALTIILPKVISPMAAAAGFFPPIKPKFRTHFHTLSSSTLHAMVSSLLSLYLLVTQAMEPNRVFSKHPLGFATMQISYGYFIADFIVCMLDPVLRNDVGTVIHHLAGMASLTLGLYYQGQLMFYIVYRLISELSTPFVNLRWYHYNQVGDKTGFWYVFASFGMLISFFLVRVAPIPWHWYAVLHTLQIPQCSVIVKLPWRIYIVGIYILFDCLNMYWFTKMCKGAIKYLTSSSSKDD